MLRHSFPRRVAVHDDQSVQDTHETAPLSGDCPAQKEFAALVCVSTKTLENREQGRRQQIGPATVLLTILEREPGRIVKVLSDATL
jgi:hypothetical protein